MCIQLNENCLSTECKKKFVLPFISIVTVAIANTYLQSLHRNVQTKLSWALNAWQGLKEFDHSLQNAAQVTTVHSILPQLHLRLTELCFLRTQTDMSMKYPLNFYKSRSLSVCSYEEFLCPRRTNIGKDFPKVIIRAICSVLIHCKYIVSN